MDINLCVQQRGGFIMAGELLKELQWLTKKVQQSEEGNSKTEQSHETSEANEIILLIPFLTKKAVRSEKKGLCVMWLDSEGCLDIINGHSVETLAGTAKIVFDWCIEEGFDTKVCFEYGPCNDGCHYLYISGW